ncbi:hypothetical protein [Xenorhabdus anantnagensis]|uniref:Uncharacterized protein n=1 Tax=Xenorhabdus anantnagensis TaxID=3025875 RepID=A0ABT5LPG2_9GAMM|nr:hypothetical protein [Xenorhabdus anantnagensis]MDC9595698.1 hypothetical protein [Xenorhabdus anantnagensis]
MKKLDKITLPSPQFPQANGTDTINIHDIREMGNKYLLMSVGKYKDEEVGDEINGYLWLSDDGSKENNTVCLKSLPYYITPDKETDSPYYLLFLVDEVSQYGTYQAQYKIISHGNERDSPIVNINLVFQDSSSLSDYIPNVPEATGEQGSLLTKNDYYRLDRLQVDVPIYEGMALGQSVKVLWQGRRKNYIYSTPTQIVNEVKPMRFTIPRMEFIDTIGDTAKVKFTVERVPSTGIEYSGILHLGIEGQDLNLPVPTLDYNNGSIQVVIRYPDMTVEQTVEIRLVGKTMVQTPYQPVDNVQQMLIDIPYDWVQENRGHLVLIDYAVGSMSGMEYRFSRVLRQIL